MKEVVPMDFQCMLKVEKSIVWHGRWKWRSLNAPNASIVAGQWYHIAFVLTRVHPIYISKDKMVLILAI
jgi:hypothetical protein